MKIVWREEEILELSSILHKLYKKIVITSGYFHPVIHSGHISLINAARKLGDVLVVIINGTNSTLRKYGKIIVPIEERLNIISQFDSVDFVIDYDESNMSKAILQLKCHIFAKGGDRTITNMNLEEILACNSINCKIKYGVGGFNKKVSNTQFIKHWNE